MLFIIVSSPYQIFDFSDRGLSKIILKPVVFVEVTLSSVPITSGHVQVVLALCELVLQGPLVLNSTSCGIPVGQVALGESKISDRHYIGKGHLAVAVDYEITPAYAL